MAKKIAKPAPKPAAKPLAKATPAPTPAPNPQSQLDLVRSPNFDAAMAQQDYANLMRDQQARIAAGRSGFSEGFRADGGQAFPPEFSRPSLEPMINPEVIQKARTEYLASQPKDRGYSQMMTKTKYGGVFGSSVGGGFDKWFEQNYINNPNSALSEQERMTLRNQLPPQGGGMGGDFRAPIRNFDIDYIEGGQRYAPVNQGPQVGGGMGGQGNFRADVAQNQFIDPQSPQGQAMQGYQQSLRNALSGYNPNVPSLMPIPQGQQMPVPDQQQGARADQYQNFLQQGLANYAAQNYPQQQQGAMGAQAAQNYAGGPMPSPAIPSPQLGGASAQPRGLPRPRQPRGFRSPIGRSAF